MTTEQKIHDIIIAHLGLSAGALDPAAKLQDDLGGDCLDVIELAMLFEDEWSIDVPDGIILGDSTVADLVKGISDLILLRAA
jgi:acyl carrier protein